MKKKKEFEKTTIEICRNCHGTGLDKENERRKCPICEGAGRVKKTLKGEVIIEVLEKG